MSETAAPLETDLDRRSTLTVPFTAPDWLTVRDLSTDVSGALERVARGVVLDVGCGEKPYRACASTATKWIGLDVDSNSQADLHGTAESIPLPPESVDTILCTQVLEHVPHPWLAVGEFQRVLRPGGVLILTVPQYWPLHEEPHDFFRFTTHGLERLLGDAGLQIEEMRGQGPGATVVAQAINNAIFAFGENTGWGHSLPVRMFKRALYTGSNAFGLLFLLAFKSNRDVLNHFVIARKPG